MKKSIYGLAVAASLSVSPLAGAAPNVYGNIHLSLNQADNDVSGANNNLVISSNTSALGVKGSEDIGDGGKVIYKAEFQVNIAPAYTTYPDLDNSGDNNGPQVADADQPFTGRDMFAGLKSGIGVIKFGTMSTNYKETGEKVDPLYRTPLEARGFLKTQSEELHSSRSGLNLGRQTNTLQYVTPVFLGGFKIVANTTFSGSNDESNGIGLRWQNKSLLVYADYIDSQVGDAKQCASTENCTTEAASKAGMRYESKAFMLGLQYEDAEKRTGGNYLFGSAQFNANRNNQIIITLGQYSAKDDTVEGDSRGYTLAYNHRFSKLTNIYFGYGAKSAAKGLDTGLKNAGDESMFTMGVRKRF